MLLTIWGRGEGEPIGKSGCCSTGVHASLPSTRLENDCRDPVGERRFFDASCVPALEMNSLFEIGREWTGMDIYCGEDCREKGNLSGYLKEFVYLIWCDFFYFL